ncbi:SRPBCC family protein [Actinoplanes sp. Pm04-4]|uniref:SRPBCC family protein n=1 Tax=Paractinoplanes pyxinae TaxID=2997416 RepID=A0ABT4B5F4_9ACTN|nr:SRPBCC family protein [Actinoplanes pyxinae]MCY1141723.1 SRPBCC family protein [Actinoplanes pyxinae]
MTTATGAFRLPMPPEQAFPLFTARGERSWVAGWEPRFPAGDVDDTEPGTVFVTGAGEQVTTWVVVDRVAGETIRYARVVPGVTAGTVRVDVRPSGAGSEVTVTYDLTALTPEAEPALRDFFAGYAHFLESWREAIGAIRNDE